MCMLDRRVQILLDEDRYRRLEAEAQRRRSSVASIVREAIDLLLPADRAEKMAAGRRILEAEPMPLPDPEELKRELDEIRGGGLL